MRLIEIVRYLRKGRKQFHRIAREQERVAEKSYQSSIQSSVDVARSARCVRSNADFLKEVMKGNG